SRSLLRFQPKIQLSNDNEDNTATDSSSSEEDNHDDDDDDELSNNDYDDYLNKLAEWEPENFQVVTESDDDNV
ncbi:unnamed protein product, partial [Rotaria magnacalcarata]